MSRPPTLPTRYHPGHDPRLVPARTLELSLRWCFDAERPTSPLGPELPGEAAGTVQEILAALVQTTHGTALLALEACPSPAGDGAAEDDVPTVSPAPGVLPHRLGTDLRLRIAPLEGGAMDAVYYLDLQPFLAQLAEQFLRTRTAPAPALALVAP